MSIAIRNLDQVKLTNLCAALAGVFSATQIHAVKDHGCPLVEDIENDLDHKRVTFLFNDENKKCISVNLDSEFLNLANLNIASEKITIQKYPFEGLTLKMPYLIMDKIATTEHGDVYATTLNLPKEACFYYKFKLKTAAEPEVQIVDPLSRQVYTVMQRDIPHLQFDTDPVK